MSWVVSVADAGWMTIGVSAASASKRRTWCEVRPVSFTVPDTV